MAKIKYVFKYDQEKNLYSYEERNHKSVVVSYYKFNYRKNSMIKYDVVNGLRIFNQFEEPCKLIHRFEVGESWIKVVAIGGGSNITYPKLRKQFALNSKDQVVKFSINHDVVKQWI